MLSENIKEVLKNNWGPKADAMNCYVEVKFIDTLSNWACYIFGLNPEDEDEIACIVNGHNVEICNWSLKELYQEFNSDGEHPIEDQEFRRIRAAELFKKLSEAR